jgi:hypothetical protein
MTKARNSSGREGSVVTGNGVPAGDLVESDMRRRVTSRRRLRLVGSRQTTLAPRPSAVDDWLLTRLPGDTRAAARIHYPAGHCRNLVGGLASDRARANRLSGSSDYVDRSVRARRRQRRHGTRSCRTHGQGTRSAAGDRKPRVVGGGSIGRARSPRRPPMATPSDSGALARWLSIRRSIRMWVMTRARISRRWA